MKSSSDSGIIALPIVRTHDERRSDQDTAPRRRCDVIRPRVLLILCLLTFIGTILATDLIGGSRNALEENVAIVPQPEHRTIAVPSEIEHWSTPSAHRATPVHGMSSQPPAAQFANPMTYSTGAVGAGPVTVADVNGDGKPDLLVGTGGGSVAVLLGNGDGTFQTSVTFSSGGYNPISIAVADVNGDGKPDLVVANYCAANSSFCSDGTVTVLLGNGDGTFQKATVVYGPGTEPIVSMAVADVNNDGKADIIVANGCVNNCGNNGTVGVLLGNGDGSFQSIVTYGTGSLVQSTTWVALGDVNGDGKLDLVVTSNCGAYPVCNPDGYGGGVTVLLGNGDGTFQEAVDYGTSGSDTTFVAIGDVNNDGKADLVISNYCNLGGIGCFPNTGDNDNVLLGSGTGAFPQFVTYNAGGFGEVSVALGDVNGDGNLDVLSASQCASSDYLCGSGTPGVVGILLGNGDGTLQAVVTYPSGGYASDSIAVADLNGDGRPDLVVSNCGNNVQCTGDGIVGVLLNTSISFGLVSNPAALSLSGPGQSASTTITIHANGNLNPQTLTNWTCSGVPAKSTCSFGTISATNQMVLTIKTTASAGLHRPSFGKHDVLFYAFLLPGFLGVLLISDRRRLRRVSRFWTLLVFLSLIAIWVGCGGTTSTGTANNGNGGGDGTPTGNYVVTVSATSGSLKPSTTIMLTVR